jgi:hypothetical protein
VGSERIIARPVAVRVRHDGLALLFHLPPHATELSRERACHHFLYDTESVVVDCSRALPCSRPCDCSLVAWPARIVDRTSGDWIDSGRIPRIVPRARSETKAGQSGDVMNKRLLCLPSLCIAPLAFGQVVFVGGQPDNDYCYKIETIHPNLELRESVHFMGRITDGHDWPLMAHPVELRKYISQRKQTIVKVTTADENGYFDMGIVEAGRYRLLASPHRGFQQPTSLKCPRGKKCVLNIALQVNNPDTPISACPVR